MKLYKCETIAQFKIGMWLVEQGIEREDILTAELLGPNEVKITNPAGQYMHIRWMGWETMRRLSEEVIRMYIVK